MTNLKLKFSTDYDTDFYDLGYALAHNDVKASSQIKKPLACLPGENDETSWHWLVELENGKIAHLFGGCDYTGWDCQSWFGPVTEYDTLDSAFSSMGLPEQCIDSDKSIRKKFEQILRKLEEF